MTDGATRADEPQPIQAGDPDEVIDLDTPYDDEHLRAVLDVPPVGVGDRCATSELTSS